MIRNILFLSSILYLMYFCSPYSKISQNEQKPKKQPINIEKLPTLADKVIWTAVSYKGTPYKFGGLNKKGMDCSGLVYTSFKQRNIDLPRTSKLMYNRGFAVSIDKVKRGDLLFFKTAKKNRGVNHVGLVTSVNKEDIKFIHATVSKGVLVSSLQQKYWKKSFVKAKRIVE
ncbi:MAG: C40 family peptidase [Tenacibaculum sp.]